jgi:hypothetical protein
MDGLSAHLDTTNSLNSVNSLKICLRGPKSRLKRRKRQADTLSFSFVEHKFFLGRPGDTGVVSYEHPRRFFCGGAYLYLRGPGQAGPGDTRWGVVQLVGHLTVNEDGEGSNPSAPANFPPLRIIVSVTSVVFIATGLPLTPVRLQGTAAPLLPSLTNAHFACRARPCGQIVHSQLSGRVRVVSD